MIDRIGARTEREPFIAHAQGIKDSSLSPRIFRPVGNGMPMTRLSGIKVKNTEIILTGIEYGEMISEIVGRSILYAMMSNERAIATEGLLKP